MIFLSSKDIEGFQESQANTKELDFVSLDDGDVFISRSIEALRHKYRESIRGMLYQPIYDEAQSSQLPIIVKIDYEGKTVPTISGFVRDGNVYKPTLVQVIHLDSEIHSRIHGLYETEVLLSKTALIIGLGSGGAIIATELSKAGVGNFILVDHDRLEVGNISRHICGMSDIGRYKTKAIRDLLLENNPYAKVETHETLVNGLWMAGLQEIVARSDIVFCCTDNRESRTLINDATVSANKTCIYGGAFRRAYGGQVLRVIPGKTLCYQCFIDTLVDDPEDQEVSNEEQAMRVAYSDRPVAIEPGLASDIAPISIMCVKVGILELLRGTSTSLASLYEDLSHPLYLWINRREKDTQYEDMNPLDTENDDESGFRILAWYGIDCEKNVKCPTCGNFI